MRKSSLIDHRPHLNQHSVVGAAAQRKSLARIARSLWMCDIQVLRLSDPRKSQDRATELEDRMKSAQAGRDPVVQGAASKLSLMEAELTAQGVDRDNINIAVSNARTQISKDLAGGKKIPVEKLANVSPDQEQKARVIVSTERNRTVERERSQPEERTPSRRTFILPPLL